MKIAIIGSGIAGNLVAHRLAADHDITVYEADHRVGGHTNTLQVEEQGSQVAVDTGFIVYNDRTYPNFIRLLNELGVDSQDSEMGFSVRCEKTGLEYSGASMNSLFAQRSNLLRPSFYRMLRDILRFNREAPRLLDGPDEDLSLNGFLNRNSYSDEFKEHYILPMGAAIWSTTPERMGAMPARFFVRFFHNHGLLSIDDRPTWKVIKGGSHRYVEKLTAGHLDRIRTSTPVQQLRRRGSSLEVKVKGAEPEVFDRVFMACHSDQALKVLERPQPLELEVLDAIKYQANEAVLHTDTSLMPCRNRAWAAWNYHITARRNVEAGPVALTYNMNILQGLNSKEQYMVTLNHTGAINPDKVIETIQYTHPIFTEQAVAAQLRHREINGTGGVYYCGAYWRNGFHEDGVVSAMNALEHFRQDVHEAHAQSRAA
jgi:predicted NAD/FAD-binding protein